jgi:hypothetical protein
MEGLGQTIGDWASGGGNERSSTDAPVFWEREMKAGGEEKIWLARSDEKKMVYYDIGRQLTDINIWKHGDGSLSLLFVLTA